MKCPDPVRLCQYYETGSAEDFEAFVVNSEPWIFSRARQLIRGPLPGKFELAEDITWTVIRKVERSRSGSPWVPEKGTLDGWLYRIIRNQVAGHLRVKSKRLRSFSDLTPAGGDRGGGAYELVQTDYRHTLPLDSLVQTELLDQVRQVLGELPSTLQKVVALYYDEGLNFREIAAQVGSNPTSVFRQIAAVREKLARLTAAGKLAA